MKQSGKIFDRLAFGVDLPTETMPGVPLVEIAGECRILIENHHGVTVYGCREIRVKVAFGQLCICGFELELTRMTKQQLVITGRIDSVTLLRGRK